MIKKENLLNICLPYIFLIIFLIIFFILFFYIKNINNTIGVDYEYNSRTTSYDLNNFVIYDGANDFNRNYYNNKDKSRRTGDEAEFIGNEIILFQNPDGGRSKNMKANSGYSEWNKSSIDNGSTWGQIYFLAKLYKTTGDEKYKESCIKGINLLINGQYENGGWPQIFNSNIGYHSYITFNDTAMIGVLHVLMDISNGIGTFDFVDNSLKAKAEEAMIKGINCILNCQIKVDGKLTAWAQQYDENSLEPTSARSYELPSMATRESVEIVNFLQLLPDDIKSQNIINSINSAINWFDDVKLTTLSFEGDSDNIITEIDYASPIRARFYNIETNKPIFFDRDGQSYDDIASISQGLRTTYDWYGDWGNNIIRTDL